MAGFSFPAPPFWWQPAGLDPAAPDKAQHGWRNRPVLLSAYFILLVFKIRIIVIVVPKCHPGKAARLENTTSDSE
jgi:hypothetical protein